MLQKGGFMEKTVVKKQEQQAELQPKFVRVCGTVTDMMYGRRTYKNGRKDKEDKFRLSIKPADGEIEKLIDEAAPYYENAKATEMHTNKSYTKTTQKHLLLPKEATIFQQSDF